MIISAINNDRNEVYIDLHAEQSFTGSFLIFNDDIDNNIIEGVYQTILKEDTVKRIVYFFEEAQSKDKLIVLDFKNINDVQMNKPELFVQLKEKTELLVFINVTKEIVEKSGISIYNSPSNILKDGVYDKFFLTENNKDEIVIENPEDLFNEVFSNNLIECKVDNSEGGKHHSSSVYLPVFLDIKKMMVNEKPFFIYVVYKLAMKMKSKWNLKDIENPEIKNPVLFCQNLNSSYIASLLSSLLKLDILSMDHIGPINKVYSNLKNRIQEGMDYIVISDLVCLGTEVKICKNVINYSGGNYMGNASVVRIETLHPKDDYNNYEYIFKITRENNSTIGYKIETALML